MKTIFKVMLLSAFTFVLTACDLDVNDKEINDQVEERTLSCTVIAGEDFNVGYTYQENRIIEIRYIGETINRFDDIEYILFIQDMLENQLTDTTLFEFYDKRLLELTDANNNCEITSEFVDFIEDPESDGISQILINTQRDSIFADSLAIENASKLYNAQTKCKADQQLSWTQIKDYIEGLDEDYYDFTNNTGIISVKTVDGWTVDLEAVGTGEWELIQDSIPSQCSRDCIVEDID